MRQIGTTGTKSVPHLLSTGSADSVPRSAAYGTAVLRTGQRARREIGPSTGADAEEQGGPRYQDLLSQYSRSVPDGP
eukprot:1566111-Rhodomonas_salina.2